MDIQLLSSMLNRRSYELLAPGVPRDLIANTTATIMGWIGAYFRAHPEVEALTVHDLKGYVKLRSTRATPEQLELTLALIDRIREDAAPNTATLLKTLNELSLAGRLGAAVERYASGDEIDLLETVREFLYEADVVAGSLGSGVDETPVDALLRDMENEGGVQLLGLPRFREQIAPLRPGTSIAFGGRPGIGKTSCIARIASDTARGLSDYFGEDRPILWLLNEGEVSKVRTRLIQAGPKITVSEMFSLHKSGELSDKYREATGVPLEFIRVAPIYGWNTAQIERLITQENPSMVIIDMLEHVHIRGGSDSKTERINDLWVWTRESALRHGYISLATTQVGADGANNLFPDVSDLHYSKTGIQSATDIIILMGADESRAGMENIRGISTPKNKAKVEGYSQIIRTETVFEMDTCDFT